MNAFLLFLAMLYLEPTATTVFAWVSGLYPPFLLVLPRIETEIFAVFLVCAFCFHLCVLYRSGKRKCIHMLLNRFTYT